MAFSVKNFIGTNKVFLIWTAFFLLLYLLRGLFGLVFLTFILCFIFNNVVELLSAKTRLRRRLWTVVVYIVFLFIVVNLLSVILPRLTLETTSFLKQAPITIQRLREYMDVLASQQPTLAPLLIRFKEALSLENILGVGPDYLVGLVVSFANRLTHYLSYFFIGTLFSFLILMDFPRLRSRLMGLRETRLREIYNETADSVVKFARVVGDAFQAQILIALINTLLTAAGLWVLQIQPIPLLAAVVFFCGLIPVLGVFISSVPIILLAFNIGGIETVLLAGAMIVAVHAIEAYILNPRIYSAVFKLNPVFTLILLYLGHTLFGMWGVLLGVPVSVYIYRHIIIGNGRQSILRLGKQGGRPEKESAEEDEPVTSEDSEDSDDPDDPEDTDD